MISGPPGIGKATLAYRLARFLLANPDPPGTAEDDGPSLFGEALPAATPQLPGTLAVDPAHPVFRRVAASGHADLLSIDRAREDGKDGILVAEARRIEPFLRLTAAEGGWRVVVVDGVDTMNAASQNAILKILEEPPPAAVLIMTADRPGALLPTIRSRCRRLVLDPLPDPVVVDLLDRYRPGTGSDAARGLAALGEGSIGRTLALVDGGGLDLMAEVLALLAGLPQLDLVAVHAFGDRMAGTRGQGDFRLLSTLLPWWLSRVARLAARGDVGGDVVPGEAMAASRLVEGAGLDRLLTLWENTVELFQTADRANLDRKQTVLAAFIGIGDAAARRTVAV